MKDNIPAFRIPLLPGRLRLPGYLLVVLGVVLLTLRFYVGLKPAWLNRNVFAFYSTYLETKKMLVISNQLLEEIAAFILLTGLLLVAFAAERKEEEMINTLRLKSFLLTLYGMAVLYTAGLAFLYGFAFLIAMMIAPFVFFIVYIITFRLLLYRYLKQRV